MRDLFAEYTAGADDLSAFYAKMPRDLWETAPVARTWDAGLLGDIKAFHSDRGHVASCNGSEAVVITGQQPGIFTGPLYTIYKGITAIKLARRLQERSGVPTAPVFWVASEDHDFDEACTTYFLSKGHEPFPIRYRPTAPVDDLPMYRVGLDDSLHAAIDEAAANTSGSEFREEVAALLHDTLDASDSLSDWTTRLLMRLFEGTPLVFFAPHLPQARKLAAGIIEREIREPLATAALLNKDGLALERLDFAPQIVKKETECCFFIEDKCRRQKVLYEKGRFMTPGDEKEYSEAELLERLAASPEQFSPNVALRCIVQQHLFPAAAYVAGPGELAYWAQLKGLFDRYGVPMPVVYPRARCVLTTIKLNKLLRKVGLLTGDLEGHEDGLLEAALRNTSKNPGYDFEREQRGGLEAALERLVEGLEKDAPTAAAMAKSLAEDMGTKLDRIERAHLSTDDTKPDGPRTQPRRRCINLAPHGTPPGRVCAFSSSLCSNGWGLIPRLIDELDVESFEMTEVEL